MANQRPWWLTGGIMGWTDANPAKKLYDFLWDQRSTAQASGETDFRDLYMTPYVRTVVEERLKEAVCSLEYQDFNASIARVLQEFPEWASPDLKIYTPQDYATARARAGCPVQETAPLPPSIVGPTPPGAVATGEAKTPLDIELAAKIGTGTIVLLGLVGLAAYGIKQIFWPAEKKNNNNKKKKKRR